MYKKTKTDARKNPSKRRFADCFSLSADRGVRALFRLHAGLAHCRLGHSEKGRQRHPESKNL